MKSMTEGCTHPLDDRLHRKFVAGCEYGPIECTGCQQQIGVWDLDRGEILFEPALNEV